MPGPGLSAALPARCKKVRAKALDGPVVTLS
jgi:hypothetical protein